MSKNTAIILVSAFIALGGGLFIYSRVRAGLDMIRKNPPPGRKAAEQAVKQLTEHGYFKYAAPEDTDSLTENLIVSIAEHGMLSSLYFEKPMISKDYRYYSFDGETLFEEGGFDDALSDMQDFFRKTGLRLEITNHTETLDPLTNGLNHELTVNGKRYLIFKDFQGHGWGEAAQRFAEMINDQLQIQGKDERLYLIDATNEGIAVFLSEKQFAIIDKLLPNDESKPLPVDTWAKVFGVSPPTDQ